MKITIKNLQKRIPVYPKRIKQAALEASLQKAKNLSGEITIFLVNEQRIRDLNLKFLHKDHPTDVISFDISKNKKEILADIFLCVDAAFENARIFKTSSLYELCLYAVHGVLHILGYDDKTKSEKELMQKKEKEILQCLSIRPKR